MKQSDNIDTSGFMDDGMQEVDSPLLPIDHTFTGWEEVYASAESFTRLFRCRRYGRLHILKVLKEEYRGITLYEQALRKEFDIAYSLDHPHICRIMAMEPLPDRGNAIVMEYVDGMTLGEWLDSSYCTKTEAYKVVGELCDTLEYLHRRQLVHRDLKPANVLVTHQGQYVKLIDFGFADGEGYEVLKGPAGTPRYMAPEAMRNDGHPDLRADIYSLGVILNELADRIGDRRMHDVARQCMAYKPEERYASATEVMTVLRMPEPQMPFVRRIFTIPIAAFVVLAGLLGWLLYGKDLSEPARDSHSLKVLKHGEIADTPIADTVAYPLWGLRAIRPLGYREDSLKYSKQLEELLEQKMPAGLTHQQEKEWATAYARQLTEHSAIWDSLNKTVKWERIDGVN